MKEIKNIFFVLLGSFFIAYSTVAFLTPNSIITGGGVGLAQLFYKLFDFITLGSWVAMVSVPLILIGMRFFGKFFVIKTVVCIIFISLFTDILKEIIKLQPATDDIILASIFGGLFVGLGVGLVMIGKSSTGGTTILAEVISLKTKYKTSQIILVIDASLMFASIFIYGDLEKALYSVIGVYITSRIIDILLSGSPAQKAVSIVTENVDELSKNILKHLGQHGTILEGVALNKEDKRTIILVIVDISKLQLLKNITKESDENAFLVIQEASELYGRDY